MFRVRGQLGDAVQDKLRSRRLCDVVYRWTAEGENKIYKRVNNALRRLNGAQPRMCSPLYANTERLVMAVRLLHDEDAGINRVFRGVGNDLCNVNFYRSAQRKQKRVQWNQFSSTSLDRDQALAFAGDNGVLFNIKRDSRHAAAAQISKLSLFPDEAEVLLLPMMQFDVLGVHSRDRYTEVVLREIAHYPGEL